MAILLNDDGQVQTWQGDDGLQYQVASQFAPPGLGAPPPAADASQFTLGGLGQPAAPAVAAAPPPPEAPAPAAIAPAPVAAEPAPAAPVAAEPAPTAPPQPEPVAAQPGLEPPPVAAEPPPPEPPSILPTGPLNTPTQVAGAINETAQERADSAFRLGQGQVSGGQQIAESGADADARIAEYEKQRAVELQQRQADEAVLGEKHQKLVNRYANFKVDPNRGMSSDRQSMAWIGAALAGLGQIVAGKDPSQNPVIPMIFAQMDRRVQLQMAERDALGQSIGQSKDAIGDFRGQTKTRLGEYDLRMGAELERHAKLVDRVKTRLGSIEQQEAATQLASTLRAEAVARTGSATKAEADQRAAARHAAASAMAAAAERQRKEEVDLAKQGLRRDPQTGAIVIDPTLQDPSKALDIQGKLIANERGRRELAGEVPLDARTTLATRKDEAARGLNDFGGKPLMRTVVGPDGKEQQVRAQASDETAATYLKTAGAAVDKLTRAADLVKQYRAKYGGNWSQLRSEEAQLLKSAAQDIDLNNIVARGMGVPTGKDEEMVQGLRGGVDIGAFLGDPTIGVESMAQRAVENYNADLRQKSDYYATGGVPLKPARSAAAKVAEQAPHERVATFTRGDPSVQGDKAAVAADLELRLAAVKTFLERDQPSPESIDAARRQVEADRAMPPGTKAQILATLNEAYDKLGSPEAKAIRKTADPLGIEDRRLLPEDLVFGLPKAGPKAGP